MGKSFTLVVVAEGAKLPGGQLVAQESAKSDRQTRLGGIGQIVADEIQSRLQTETRAVVLGHLQRGGAPTYFDRCLSTQYGAHAVRLVEERRFGEMVCYDPPDITSVPLTDAVKELGVVDPLGSAVQAARAMAVSFGDQPGFSNPFPRSKVTAKTLIEKFDIPLASLNELLDSKES